MCKNILFIAMIIFFCEASEVSAQTWDHYRRVNNAVNQTRRTVDYYNRKNKNQPNQEPERGTKKKEDASSQPSSDNNYGNNEPDYTGDYDPSTTYVVSKNLSISLNNSYPDGLPPKWEIFEKVTSYQLDYEYISNLPEHLKPKSTNMGLRIENENGRAKLLIEDYGCFTGCVCMGDFAIKGHKIISQTKMVLNFDALDAPGGKAGCKILYKGWISLQVANKNDDLLMSLYIEEYERYGPKTTELKGRMRLSNVTIPNKRTTSGAAKELVQKGGRQAINKEMAMCKDLKQKFDDYVYVNSRDWWINKYRHGNIKSVEVASYDNKDSVYEVKGIYLYDNAGRQLEGTLTAFVKQDICFYMKFWDSDKYLTPLLKNGTPEQNYSEYELKKIASFQKKFDQKRAVVQANATSQNYSDLVQVQKQYDKYPMRNALAEATYYWTERVPVNYVVQDVIGYRNGQADWGDVTKTRYETETHKEPGLKNISDGTIIIKGITKENRRGGGYVYSDASIRVEPGETIRKIKIVPSYNDNAGTGTQYFGNAGTIKK